MNRDSVEILLEYNRWADAKMLDAVAALTPDQFSKDMGTSHGSIRKTLAHILFSEEVWLMRWKGISPKEVPEAGELPDLPAIRSRWHDYHMDLRNFFSKMSDENMLEVISYDNFQGEERAYPLWQMMHHIVNHSSYHRGQIVTMLRQLGAAVVPLDFLLFMDERAPR